MNNQIASNHYKFTPWAILFTLLLSVPGVLLGGLVKAIYTWQFAGYFDGNLVNWVSSGWFKILFMSIFPHLVHFGVAGAFSIWLCSKIFKSANYEIVSYSVSGIFLVLALLIIGFNISQKGISLEILELISETVGFISGLFIVWAESLRG